MLNIVSGSLNSHPSVSLKETGIQIPHGLMNPVSIPGRRRTGIISTDLEDSRSEYAAEVL